jgi:hypothetical protein
MSKMSKVPKMPKILEARSYNREKKRSPRLRFSASPYHSAWSRA